MTSSWVNSAERIGVDLHLELPATGGRRAALITALREAVRGGRLAPGTRLPPYRSLAADLGLARNTVADAYAELVAEGWLTARQGSGTRVAERAEPLRHAGKRPVAAPPRARTSPPPHSRASTQPPHSHASTQPSRARASTLPPNSRASTQAPNSRASTQAPNARPSTQPSPARATKTPPPPPRHD
ncbi:GntR family transcriptional regulator, partial [Streptomyces griseorubiginosus]|uniref:GntR family transcriptional regulator n=1 Tax=Streptomyces griseorubiginosus TaxID=67304 RepID=UPI003F770F41